MNPFNLLDRRYRGFRVIEIGGLGFLLVLALVVYLAKTHAGGERADIDRIQAQIDDEKARVTLLRAEVAKLEQPERLESLSGRYLNLQPVPPSHEIAPTALASLARPAPAPAPQPALTPAPQPALTPQAAQEPPAAASTPAHAASATAAAAAAPAHPARRTASAAVAPTHPARRAAAAAVAPTHPARRAAPKAAPDAAPDPADTGPPV